MDNVQITPQGKAVIDLAKYLMEVKNGFLLGSAKEAKSERAIQNFCTIFGLTPDQWDDLEEQLY